MASLAIQLLASTFLQIKAVLFLFKSMTNLYYESLCKVTVGALHHRERHNSALHFCIISLEHVCQVLSAAARVRFKIYGSL